MTERMDERTRQVFISRLEKVLSDILSAKYDCKITVKMKKKPGYEGGAESEN